MACYFKRKDLNLKDIGFQTSARIFINESLTKLNREIFNVAAVAKKSNHIVKLFTRNGLVYVQRRENDKPACIQHISDLEQILPPPSYVRTSYNSSQANRRWPHDLPHSNSPIPNNDDTRSSVDPRHNNMGNNIATLKPMSTPIVPDESCTLMDSETSKSGHTQPLSVPSTQS